MFVARAAFVGLVAIAGAWPLPLLGQVGAPTPSTTVALAISCDGSTPEKQKSYLLFNIPSGRDKLCLDSSTFVKDIHVVSAEIWEDKRVHVWWLIVKFSDSTKPLIDAVASKAYMRELALIVDGKILSSALVIGVPAEPEYSATTEGKDMAQNMLAVLNRASAH